MLLRRSLWQAAAVSRHRNVPQGFLSKRAVQATRVQAVGRLSGHGGCLAAPSFEHPLQQQQFAQFSTRRRSEFSEEAAMNEGFENAHWVKKMVSLAVGYVGTGYHGLTYVSGAAPEIEGVQNVLHKAMCDAGVIMPSNQHHLRRIKLSQSSRTDKGVHAALVVLSAKILVGAPSPLISGEGKRGVFFPEVVERINRHLPGNIRVFSCALNSNKFEAKRSTSWRHYHYMLPLDLPETKGLDLDTFASAMQSYEGTHNFSQFTKQREMRRQSTDGTTDQSEKDVLKRMRSMARRHLLRIRVSPVEVEGRPFARVDLLGQSFVLNQIRYMIGGALAATLGLIPRSTLRLSLRGFDIDSIIEDICDNEKLLFPHGREAGSLNADELARFARDVAELLHSKDGPVHRLGPRLSEPELIAKLVAGGGLERPVGWRPFRLPLAPPQLLLARTLGLNMRSNTFLVMPSTVDGLDTLLSDGNVVEGAPANDDERCGRLIDGHLWYDDTRSSSLGVEDDTSVVEKQQQQQQRRPKKATTRGRGGDGHGIGRRDDGEFLGRFAVLDDAGISLAHDFYSSVLLPHVASLADPSLESDDPRNPSVAQWFKTLHAEFSERDCVQAVWDNVAVLDAIDEAVEASLLYKKGVKDDLVCDDAKRSNWPATQRWGVATLQSDKPSTVQRLRQSALRDVRLPPAVASELVRQLDLRPGRFVDNVKMGLKVLLCEENNLPRKKRRWFPTVHPTVVDCVEVARKFGVHELATKGVEV